MSAQDHPISAALASDSFLEVRRQMLSDWAASRAKRIFDATAVLVFSPLWIPLFVILGAAVRLSSRGPAIFRQTRAGCCNRFFTIYKFRTMRHLRHSRRNAIAAISVDEVTPVGRILRRFKLDELPQLINVLLGHMSLVGPRPKVPEQQLEPLPCRPGITGSATLAFARENSLFAQIPEPELTGFYHDVVLPAKYRLDWEYMRRATLSGDLRILLDTILGRWGAGEAAISSPFNFEQSPTSPRLQDGICGPFEAIPETGEHER
jgi:lipopolysaccharide/colanic/teichoic acid biosynthesis glycosyltransferase